MLVKGATGGISHFEFSLLREPHSYIILKDVTKNEFSSLS